MPDDRAPDLRAYLRSATAPLHDRLDARLAPMARGDARTYTDFLAVQFHARVPIERWVEDCCPPSLRPPAQTHLIAADFAEMAAQPPRPGRDFTPEVPGEAIGIAWTLAGSSLGNKAMLARRRRAGDDQPAHFLGDTEMGCFWTALVPHLAHRTSPAAADAAVRGACRVFETFLASADAMLDREFA